MKVAILGANGFVGHRLFELWHQRGPHQPRATVRSPVSLARIARFEADWRIADARNATALAEALRGCDAVVHCAVGDVPVIKRTIDPVYQAARAAGISKLVYLSSASVHGQNPPPGTTEASALNLDQPLAYNSAKIWAERRLQALARGGPIDTVILRPGIVFGPRSRWVTEVAEALVGGTAHWIEGGRGICNSIYVDNLVHAVEQALASTGARGDAYLVGDAETVTWRDFYLGIATALGRDETAFAEAIPTQPRPRTWFERLDAVRASPGAQRVIAQIPGLPKEVVKAALSVWKRLPPADPWALPPAAPVRVATLEMSLLFACRTKFSHAKAAERLGYRPPVAFAEGLRRSVTWLRQLELGSPP